MVSAVNCLTGSKNHYHCNKINDKNGILNKKLKKYKQQFIFFKFLLVSEDSQKKKRDVAVAETMFASVIAQNDLPYSLDNEATEVFPDLFNDSKIAKEEKKLSHRISDEISSYLKEEIISNYRT